MIRSLCILFCLAFPAHAGKVTMTGADCSVVSNGPDYTITCGAKVEPTPPIVVPPVTPPVTPPAGCTTPPGVLPLLVDPVAGQARQVSASTGQILSGPLPAGRPQGGFISSDYVGTPPMTIEWSLSPCPGDVNFYKSAEGKALGVCGRTSGTQGGGITWNVNPPPRSSTCKIDARQWYVNYRILSGCPSVCPINYQWN